MNDCWYGGILKSNYYSIKLKVTLHLEDVDGGSRRNVVFNQRHLLGNTRTFPARIIRLKHFYPHCSAWVPFPDLKPLEFYVLEHVTNLFSWNRDTSSLILPYPQNHVGDFERMRQSVIRPVQAIWTFEFLSWNHFQHLPISW